MRSFRCLTCKEQGLESDWEHHHRRSYCQTCGSEGHEIVEWGCFDCSEEGHRFFELKDSDPPCPKCHARAVRIMYAPMIADSQTRAKGKFADKLLEGELQRRGMTDLAPSKPKAQPSLLAPRWGNAGEVLAQGAGLPGSQENFGLIKSAPQRLLTNVIADQSSKPRVPAH